MIERHQAGKPDLVLIPGWDPRKYTHLRGASGAGAAWEDQKALIEELARSFTLYFFNLPGFVGEKEPPDRCWDTEDFAKAFDGWMGKLALRPLAVLGYSFGGAVALMWKHMFHRAMPLVLISPSIIRSSPAPPTKKTGRLRALARHCYSWMVDRNYRTGTPFLRRTHDRIVRRDLRALLQEVEPQELLLIYGGADLVTPWTYVRDIAQGRQISSTVVDGRHSLGRTHPREIADAIRAFLKGQMIA